MKKIKHYVLGLLVATVVLLAGLYSCSNEETGLQQKELNTTLLAKPGDDSEGTKVAIIEGEEVMPLYDEILLKEALVSEGIFVEIESIDLDYGFDPEKDKYEAFLTIIGKDKDDFSLVAFQAELIIDGDELFIMNPETSPSGLFNTHNCIGQNCRKCAYERSGFLGLKIVGCKPCGAVNDSEQPGYCNHSINGGNIAGPIVKEIVKSAI